MSIDSQEILSVSVLVVSTLVSVDELLCHMMRRLGIYICLTVALMLHRVLQPGTQDNQLDNFVHVLLVVDILVGFFRVHFGVWLLLC